MRRTTPQSILLMSQALDLGGSERQLTEIAKALDPERYRVHVGCSVAHGMREAELRDKGIPIVEFPMHSYASVGALRAAARLIAYITRHGIALVHAFDVPMDVFAVPTAKASLRPVVLASQRAHRMLTSSARLKVLRITDRFVDGIVVNCEYIRTHLMQEEHVPSAKIHLCYNGLDLTLFSPRGSVASDGGVLTIGCICALRPEKNLPLLIRAFADVWRFYPQCRLLVVGSGPMQSEMEQVIRECGIGSVVTLVPKTNHVTRWLHKIDIFVLASRTEALSNALMEAMACGCCVVASNVGGNPELVGSNERGLLFDSEDRESLAACLKQLVQDSGLRNSLAHAARAFVESRLSIQTSVKRMTEIYDSFLAN